MQSIFRHDLPRKFVESFISLQAITQAVSWMLGRGGYGHTLVKIISVLSVLEKTILSPENLMPDGFIIIIWLLFKGRQK
jgi:hypothetical protein